MSKTSLKKSHGKRRVSFLPTVGGKLSKKKKQTIVKVHPDHLNEKANQTGVTNRKNHLAKTGPSIVSQLTRSMRCSHEIKTLLSGLIRTYGVIMSLGSKESLSKMKEERQPLQRIQNAGTLTSVHRKRIVSTHGRVKLRTWSIAYTLRAQDMTLGTLQHLHNLVHLNNLVPVNRRNDQESNSHH